MTHCDCCAFLGERVVEETADTEVWFIGGEIMIVFTLVSQACPGPWCTRVGSLLECCHEGRQDRAHGRHFLFRKQRSESHPAVNGNDGAGGSLTRDLVVRLKPLPERTSDRILRRAEMRLSCTCPDITHSTHTRAHTHTHTHVLTHAHTHAHTRTHTSTAFATMTTITTTHTNTAPGTV
jgi:hypothetical protein